MPIETHPYKLTISLLEPIYEIHHVSRFADLQLSRPRGSFSQVGAVLDPAASGVRSNRHVQKVRSRTTGQSTGQTAAGRPRYR